MTHQQICDALDVCVPARRPVFINGAPGCGKTQLSEKYFHDRGYQVITESAVHYDPVDIKGTPWPDRENNVTRWFPPELILKVRNNGGKVAVFWDDLPTAPPLVQAALYRFMLEHKIGEERLPDSVYVFAAGNRMIDAAAVHEMPVPLRNRLVHLHLETSPEAWTKWAADAEVQPELIGFIRFRPELLHVFSKKDYAQPSPRTWEFVSQLMAQNPSPNIEFELYEGCVGTGAATELMGFLKLFRELPSVYEILMHPKEAPVPKDPGTQYAVSSAIARAATKLNLEAVMTYADRLPPEFGILTIRDATERDASLMRTPLFISWGQLHNDFLRGSNGK